MHEKCGVVGLSLPDEDAARPLYYSLYALQHRGQESAGIVTHDGFQQHDHVEMGEAEKDTTVIRGDNVVSIRQ